MKPCIIKRNKERLLRLKAKKVISFPNEEWEHIKGYEGYYMVSNMGRVKSLFRVITYFNGKLKTFPESLMALTKDDDGYFYVCLHRNNKIKRFAVHRLLMLEFVPNLENKCDVNHKNGNPSDNDIKNLEWSTRSENLLHAYRELGKAGSNLNKTGDKSLASKPVITWDKLGNKVTHVSMKECAKYFGIHWSTIHNTLRNKYARRIKLKDIRIKFKYKKDYKRIKY